MTMSDGIEQDLGNIQGPQGQRGLQGVQGPKGDKGDLPYVQYVVVGNKARIFGPTNSNITIGYMSNTDAENKKPYSASVNTVTDKNGTAVIPVIPTGNFLEFYVDNKLVGIGVS